MQGRNRGYDRAAYGGMRGGTRYDAGMRGGGGGSRPWVGGYRESVQGGSEGIPVGRGRRWGTERPDAADRGTRPGRSGRGGGRDLWWLGYHGYDEQYADARGEGRYRRFHEQNHPRFSPVGGMYGPVSTRGRPPRPLAYDRWFSDWTRWF